MHRLTLAAAILFLAGCDLMETRPQMTTVDMAKTVAIAKVIYDAALKRAADYAKLPACGVTKSLPGCHRKDVLLVMRKAEIAADAATQAAADAVKELTQEQAVVRSTVDAATKSAEAFKLMTDIYAAPVAGR